MDHQMSSRIKHSWGHRSRYPSCRRPARVPCPTPPARPAPSGARGGPLPLGRTAMSDVIVGIDLGTTNSEVAAVRDSAPAVLAEDGDPILPSVVGLAADGRLLVGHAARNQFVLAPERTVRSI